MIIKVVLFVVISVIVTYFSRSSLRNPRSHGFYRFFAWEGIVAVISLNVDSWFTNPFSVFQIISWVLLIISAYLIIQGITLLREIGKPNETRDDSSLLGLEKTTQLVVVGAYRYIRHPFYSSLLFLCWGAFFKSISLAGLMLCVIATIFLILTGKVEEKENMRYFGKEYKEYMKKTKMFIPFVL
ncbi:MAG: isoprenylcysteine carboxyl methyltransferase [Deltaproteobacteria bacterium RBG_13_52_11]|nr:MAG: isoprenylcysteine carboxyl methyltransferase [Deltaproteobacteria bacterium RBG_13_52_11]